jgi:lathosterol oxidase
MDWLAGSRLHLVDIVVTRGLSFVPLYVLGFAPGAVFAYVLFVSFQAVLIHANVSWRFGPLRFVLATPQYHHWHHAVEPVDVNFAVHLPVIDRIFGTQYLPRDRWPSTYGLAGAPVPGGYWRQLAHPFRAAR